MDSICHVTDQWIILLSLPGASKSWYRTFHTLFRSYDILSYADVRGIVQD
jgi:hypothetical protein